MSRARHPLLRHAVLLGVGVGLLVLLVLIGGRSGLDRLSDPALWPLSGAIVATLLIALAVAVRWRLLAASLTGREVAGTGSLLHYFLVSRVVSFVVPKEVADLGGRAVALHRLHGVGLMASGASVVLDRLLDLAAGLLCLVAVTPYWLGWTGPAATLALVVLAAALGALAIRLRPGLLVAVPVRLLDGLARLGSRLASRWVTQVEPLETSGLDGPVLVRGYLISLVKLGLTAGRMVLFSLTLRLGIDPLLILFATPVGQLGYAVAFTPGALGIYEAGWFVMLTFGEAATAEASALVVGQRVLTLAIIAALAVPSHLVYSWGARAAKARGATPRHPEP